MSKGKIKWTVLILALMVLPALAMGGDAKLKKVKISMRPNAVSPYLNLGIWDFGRKVSGESKLQLVPGAEFKINVEATGGSWVGVSFMDSKGKVYDVKANQKRLMRGYADFSWALPGNFPRGSLKVTIALWKDYDEKNDLMVGELDRIPWTVLGTCDVCN